MKKIECNILDDISNFSDHQAINFSYSVDISENTSLPSNIDDTIPRLNLEDPLIQDFFSQYIGSNLDLIESCIQSCDSQDKQIFMNNSYNQYVNYF